MPGPSWLCSPTCPPGASVNSVTASTSMFSFRPTFWRFIEFGWGRVTLSEALRRQQVQLDGTSSDVRSFSHWFSWSPMADAVRAALADRRAASDNRHHVTLARVADTEILTGGLRADCRDSAKSQTRW